MNRRRAAGLGVAFVFLAALVAWLLHARRHEESTVERTRDRNEARLAEDRHESTEGRSRVIETPAEPEPSSDAAATAPATRTVRLRAGWGSGEGQLGRRLSADGTPESPNSFVVDAEGNVLVLDQMNQRILRFAGDGGAVTTAATLESTSARDLAVARDGTMAVLDGNPDAGTVRVIGPDGRPRGELPLRGENLAADEHATGVVVDGDNVYVERDHGPLVRIGSTNGTADGARTEIPGRPSRDGRLYLSGGITDPDQGRYWVNVTDRATGMHRYTLALHSVLTLREMMLLDTDRAGTIYVAVMGLTPETGDHDSRESIQLNCLDPESGQIIGHAVTATSNLQEIVQRELVVLDDGGVLITVRSDTGFEVQRIDCH